MVYMANSDLRNGLVWQDFPPGLMFLEPTFSNPNLVKTVLNWSNVNEAILNFDQHFYIPIILARSNGLDIRKVMGPIRTS